MDLCDTEKRFYENWFTDNFRVDGRTNDQLRPIRIKYGSIPAAWGSATIVYGDDDNEITVSIKGINHFLTLDITIFLTYYESGLLITT